MNSGLRGVKKRIYNINIVFFTPPNVEMIRVPGHQNFQFFLEKEKTLPDFFIIVEDRISGQDFRLKGTVSGKR